MCVMDAASYHLRRDDRAKRSSSIAMTESIPSVEQAGGTPVREAERVVALDVLRGFALIGVLVVNMQFFAMPFADALHDESLADASTASQLAWALTKVLFEFKSISLFSLLFGMGLVLQMNRAEAANRPFVPLYLRRLAVLFIIGLAHALLFWYGDILLIYSVLGVGLLLFRRLQPRVLLAAGAACIALGSLLFLLTVAMEIVFDQSNKDEPSTGDAAVAERGPERPETGGESEGSRANDGTGGPGAPDEETEKASARPPVGFAAIVAAEGDPFAPPWVDGEVAAYRDGPFIDALVYRTVTYAYCVIAAMLGYGWRVLGLFLAGAALLKLGFFSPERRPWHRRLALVGLGVGLPIELFSAWLIHALDYRMTWGSLAAAALHEAGSLLLCLGYAGAVVLLASSGALAWLCHGLGCVGRMALSNYLSQTLFVTFVMYWWGLGFFDTLSRPRLLMLAAVIYVALTAASVVWLGVFTIGPAEWLWRSLTYGRLQPLRRLRT